MKKKTDIHGKLSSLYIFKISKHLICVAHGVVNPSNVILESHTQNIVLDDSFQILDTEINIVDMETFNFMVLKQFIWLDGHIRFALLVVANCPIGHKTKHTQLRHALVCHELASFICGKMCKTCVNKKRILDFF